MTKSIVTGDPDAGSWNKSYFESARGRVAVPVGVTHVETPVHFYPNGGEITLEGGAGVYTSEAAQFHDDNPQYAVGAMLVPSNPAPDRDFLVLCGTNQKVKGGSIYGRRWIRTPDLPTGPRAKSCIAIEGRSQPPTGRHRISDCLLADADVGIATLATPVEDHADLLHVDNVWASNCRAFFQSNNIQSVSHAFYDCKMESGSPMVAFEILRGGKIDVFGFRQNGPFATVIALRDDCAPNGNYVGIYGYQWDHVDAVGAYFAPLDTDKPSLTGCVYGHANNPQFRFERRIAGLFRNPRFKCDVAGVN